MTKTCIKCGETKPVEEFAKNENRCLCCKKLYVQEYAAKNKEKMREYRKKYKLANKEKIHNIHKRYRENNKEKLQLYHKEYLNDNRDKIELYRKEYYINNAETLKDKGHKYYNENKEKIKEYKIKTNPNRNVYRKNKYITDELYNLSSRIRSRTISAFKYVKSNKPTKTEKLLGCDWQYFKSYFESKFTDGMSWDNRHLWHIDHIIPLASANTEDEVIKLCHYTNLQPLWAADNIRKGAKLLL